MPALATARLHPSARRFDTLQSPLGPLQPRNPGTVEIARSRPGDWSRIVCAPGSLLSHIEVRPHKGLLNLTASELFATGSLSPTRKRDLQRAVASVVAAYNALASQAGVPGITIHENHLQGDGKVHEDRRLPRVSNERDYDYYHTLGVSYADNGRMLPHYHLEFGRHMHRHSVAPLLESLHRIGQEVLGQDILGTAEIASVLRKLPAGRPVEGLDAQRIEAARQRLPSELASPQERARARDELEGAFIALSSQNTEDVGADKPFLRNMHMNTFRPAEPLPECFSDGHTSVMDDLTRIEAQGAPGAEPPLPAAELLSIYQAFRAVSRELANGGGGAAEPERQAVLQRLAAGMERTRQLLRSS